MKNRTFKTFVLVLLLALVSILVCGFFPVSPMDVSNSKWKWIKAKIFSPRKTIDYAIVGSSYAWCGIRPDLISDAMKAPTVWNLGRNWDGRDVDYIIIKALLEHHDVKNILLHFYETERPRVHPYTKHLISPGDAVDELVYYVRNTTITDKQAVKENIGAILSYFGNLSVRNYLKLLGKDAGYSRNLMKRNDRTNGFYIYDANLKQKKSQFARYENVPWKLEFGRRETFPSRSRSGFYLDKIHRLCAAHGVKLYFVFIPNYMQPLPSRSTFDYLSERGDVLIPNLKGLTRTKYWRDLGHFYQEGSVRFTRRLIRLLKEGKEASPYYKYYLQD